MHMAAVIEMTVIRIEFADQLVLVGVGDADAEVSRHTGSGRGRSHRLAGHFGLIARGVVPTGRPGGVSPPASLAADGTSKRSPRRNLVRIHCGPMCAAVGVVIELTQM